MPAPHSLTFNIDFPIIIIEVLVSPDQFCLSLPLHLHQLFVPLLQPVDAVLPVVSEELVEPDHSLLLHLPLHTARPLPPHDPDGVPGLHVVVVDEVAGAHHASPASALCTVNSNSLQWKVVSWAAGQLVRLTQLMTQIK